MFCALRRATTPCWRFIWRWRLPSSYSIDFFLAESGLFGRFPFQKKTVSRYAPKEERQCATLP
ncbi:MAG: hypothetical protein IJV43_06470, partial [Oscillospiraceae bacterium]|nr:hypothetical protein [Oscillospiraceae bacterium]